MTVISSLRANLQPASVDLGFNGTKKAVKSDFIRDFTACLSEAWLSLASYLHHQLDMGQCAALDAALIST